MMAIIGTFTYEFQVSLPLLADTLFHTGAGGYAAMTTAMGVGSIVGGIVIASQKKGSIRLLVSSAALFGFVILLASVMPTYVLMLAMLIVVGAFSVHFTSLSNSILQLSSAPGMRGRVMSLWTIAFLGSTTIGGPIIGWIGEFLGPRWGLAVGGIAALAASVVGLRTLNARRFSLEASDPVVGAAEIRAEEDVRIP
jgi:MFS family permease